MVRRMPLAAGLALALAAVMLGAWPGRAPMLAQVGSGPRVASLMLVRDAANILAQRNGTNAQKFRVYNTFTDAANYERLEISTAAASTDITQQQAGTGSARVLNIGTSGSATVQFFTFNLNRWNISTVGNLLANTDNTYDIGASGATRPRNLFVGTNVEALGYNLSTATGSISWSGGGSLNEVSNGVFRFSDNAQTGFTRLILGTNDASGVSLAKNATVLETKLGDSTAFARHDALGFRAYGAASGIGYGTGAGGTVTQGAGSGKATALTLSTVSGAITMDGASLAADTAVSFTWTNTAIAEGDVVMINITGGTAGSYNWTVDAGAGTATVTIRNVTAGALAEAIMLNFVVFKAVTS